MAEGCVGVLLGSDLDVATQLRWAARIAETRSSDLLIFEHVESREGKTVEVPLDQPPRDQATPVERRVMDVLGDSPSFVPGRRDDEPEGDGAGVEDGEIVVRLKQIRCPDLSTLRQQLLAQVRKNKLKTFTLARAGMDTSNPDLVRERRLFLRYAPCEVVLCYGLDDEHDAHRILVAVASGPHNEAALRLGRDLSSESDGTLTAVRVNPSIGPDAVRVGERRLDSTLRKILGKRHEGVAHRVVVDDQVPRGLRKAWEEGDHDLVLLGASRHGLLGNQPGRGTAAKLSKADPGPAIAIVSAGSPIRNRFRALVEGGIERVVPQIDRDNRISLVDRVQSSSNWDFDFFALMVLSTAIAAIGLIQNSAAVVIGAMLVAPLMTPLLGLALALVQGNPVLARISIRAVVLGLGVSLLVGVVTGLATPGFAEPTREMLGRGGPGLLDLFVAFASGLAAAYASSRPGLLAALPGVAIAAALVPPIATSGLALSLGDVDLAVGALLLFIINMVTIVLASMVSLWVVGLRRVGRASRWALTAVGVLLLSVLALGVYLSVRPAPQPSQVRIPQEMVASIQQRLGADYRLESVAVAYDELGLQLNVRISGATLASEVVAQEIRKLASKVLARPVRVRLTTEVKTEVVPLE